MRVRNNLSDDKGVIYLFDVLADTPIRRIETESISPIGELRISDFDGTNEILLGVTRH
ncbi:MAG: hypothetical protein ABJK28_09110 [Algibacter sp.]